MRAKFGGPETWQLQYAYLQTLLEAQAAVGGSLYIAAGNQAVRVSELAPPDKGDYPSVGFQFASRTNQNVGMRVRQQINTFQIMIVCNVGFSADPDIERTLKRDLENLANDGQGHGVLPLLYQDITLGGTAQTSIDTEISVSLGQADDESMEGRMMITFTATAEQSYS